MGPPYLLDPSLQKIQKQVDLLKYFKLFYFYLHHHIEQKQKPVLKQKSLQFELKLLPPPPQFPDLFYQAHAFSAMYLSRP